jgi:anti-sigma regulatory factor (Ser/Thr protein kinase)
MTDVTRTFHGVPGSARLARRWVAGVLDEAGFPGPDDVILVTSELVTNAIEHSMSGAAGGQFDLTVSVLAGVNVGITVRDAGPADGMAAIVPAARPPEDREGGRGLWLVTQLSDGFSHDGRGRYRASFGWDGQRVPPARVPEEGALFALPGRGAR